MKLVRFLFVIIPLLLQTVLTYAASPSVIMISPSFGSSPPNVARTFTCIYSDVDGWTNLKEAYLLICKGPNSFIPVLTNSVYLYYDQNTNLLYLRDDANSVWLGGYAPGSNYIIENSQAKLNCSHTTVRGSGNTLTVKFNVTFKPSYSSKTYYTFLKIVDDIGLLQGWLVEGTFTVNYKPTVGTITPSSGNAQIEVPVTFITTYSDGDGFQHMYYIYFLMNTSTSGSNCLYAYYNQHTNKLYLRNDANSSWLGGYPPGSSYVIENSYAKLNCASTSVSGLETTLTVNWSVALKFPSVGTKNTYLRVTDDVSASSGWIKKGTWTIEYLDTTPPTGTITINNDDTYTTSSLVTLTLSATDLESGMGLGAQMQFSNDNIAWSTPEAYTTTKDWTLTEGDGPKTVYAKFKDAAGNWSDAFSDTITLNTMVVTITNISYFYDDLNRLKNITFNGTNTAYIHDEVGNIKNETTERTTP